MMTARARSVLYLTWLSARFSVGRLVGITVGVALGSPCYRSWSARPRG